MRSIALLLTALALSAGCWIPAYAASDASHREKIDELMSVLEYESTLKEFIQQCDRSLMRMHPERLVTGEPHAFGGLAPGHRGWPEIVTAFDDFVREACGDTAALLDAYRVAWEGRLSEDQMDAALSFLATSDGRAFGAALAAVHRSVAERYEDLGTSQRARALERFQRRVEQIVNATAR